MPDPAPRSPSGDSARTGSAGDSGGSGGSGGSGDTGDSGHTGDSRAIDLVGRLRAWMPLAPAQAVLRNEYLEFVLAAPRAALERHGGPEHVTGSCFVFTPDLAQVLLCFHKKGRFWVQLGGHIEPADASVADTALREAREECGIIDLVPVRGILDLDRHALGGGFSCRAHWDVGFAAIARPEAAPVASDESDDVAWWPVDALPENVPPHFARRVAGVLAELEQREAPDQP